MICRVCSSLIPSGWKLLHVPVPSLFASCAEWEQFEISCAGEALCLRCERWALGYVEALTTPREVTARRKFHGPILSLERSEVGEWLDGLDESTWDRWTVTR